MGCVTSKQEHVNHPRIFHVWNVDGDGRHLKPGRIEVTDSQLILSQKGGGDVVVRWPLKSLRRYGFDSEVFSFECGRRCATGPGVYAFKCRRAQALFTVLQECINGSGGSPEDPAPPLPDGDLRNGSCPTVDAAGYLEPVSANSHLRFPAGPRAAGSPGGYVCIHSDPSAHHHYTNAEIVERAAGGACAVHHYVNSPAEAPPRCRPDQNGVDADTNYAKLDDLLRREQQQSAAGRKGQPFYVNVSSKSTPAASPARRSPEEEEGPPGEERVNYAVLDLDRGEAPGSSSREHSAVSSPARSPEGYAQIDFDKTVALSNSTAIPLDDDDGSVRKTRHNAATPCPGTLA